MDAGIAALIGAFKRAPLSLRFLAQRFLAKPRPMDLDFLISFNR
jgi:hypothetical protein